MFASVNNCFLFIGHFYASYRQLTISTNNSLPLRGYHVSHPPMHRYLPLWLSIQHMICVCLRLMKNQKRYDITINYCEPESGWLHGILIGGCGNRQCFVVKHFERQQQLGVEKA